MRELMARRQKNFRLISDARPPTALLLPVRLMDFGKSTPAALIDITTSIRKPA
jgi:hypothetical protein